jgi:hypothetical protein
MNQRAAQPHRCREGAHDLRHLRGQLPRRHQHQGSRPNGCAVIFGEGERRDHGNSESNGLATARLAAPEHVLPGQRVRDRRRLDRERHGDASCRQGCDDRRRDAQLDERAGPRDRRVVNAPRPRVVTRASTGMGISKQDVPSENGEGRGCCGYTLIEQEPWVAKCARTLGRDNPDRAAAKGMIPEQRAPS